MTRLVAAVLLAALVALPGQARAQLILKPAVGVNLTDFSKDPQSGQAKGKVGWQAGGTVQAGERLYLEGGLFYARRSTDITTTTGQAVDVNGITGLRIPVAVGYHLIGDAKSFLALRGFGGASAFLVTSVSAAGMSKSDFTSPTYGVFAGVGLDLAFLFAEVKYEWSLSDTSKLSTVDVGASRAFFVDAGLRL